jgi:hypothetical protein
MQKVK